VLTYLKNNTIDVSVYIELRIILALLLAQKNNVIALLARHKKQ